MRGITETSRHEPQLNPSIWKFPQPKLRLVHQRSRRVRRMSQGGESEWNSVAASSDETHGRSGRTSKFRAVVNTECGYATRIFANKSEVFVVRVSQSGREVFAHEFANRDIIDSQR